MIAQTAWLDRKFTFDLSTGEFPPLLERMRGTPARAKQLVTALAEDMLATRVIGKWSVKEHLGHLVDLEPLDDRRLSEFLCHKEMLSAADMENHATENADHRSTPVAEIVSKLTVVRDALVRRLEVLTEEQIGIVAIHPRLRTPMRLLDWVYFLAEHDDHHLSLARRVIIEQQTKKSPSQETRR